MEAEFGDSDVVDRFGRDSRLGVLRPGPLLLNRV
jgi:hypothetical protein